MARWENIRKGSLREQTLLRQWGIQIELLREQSLLRQWGNIDRAPAGADTAAAVEGYRKGSCGSRHCCGSGGVQTKAGCSAFGMNGVGMGRCRWIWVMLKRGWLWMVWSLSS